MRARQRIVGMVGLILVSLSPIQAQQTPPVSQSVMLHATKLFDASDQLDPLYRVMTDDALDYFAPELAEGSDWVGPLYLWRGPDTLLMFRGDNRNSSVSRFIQVNTRTRRSQPLTQLNKAWKRYLATFRDGAHRLVLDASLSPDGNQLLLDTRWTFVYKPGVQQISEVTPDGYVLFSLKAAPSQPVREDWWFYNSVWTRDSRSCIGIYSGGKLETHLIRGESPPTSPWQDVPQSAILRKDPRGDAHVLGFMADEHVLVACIPEFNVDNLPMANQAAVNLVSLGLKTSAIPPRVMRISLPKDLRIWYVWLSPDGKKLAWMFEHYPTSQVTGRPVSNTFDYYEFWISRADGTGMTRLGWIEPRGDKREQVYTQYPAAIAWMPDSQHISFVYQDALYSIPADLP
jgi:hypothetical protein